MQVQPQSQVLTFYIPEVFFNLHAPFINRDDFRWIPLGLLQVTGQQPRLTFRLMQVSSIFHLLISCKKIRGSLRVQPRSHIPQRQLRSANNLGAPAPTWTYTKRLLIEEPTALGRYIFGFSENSVSRKQSYRTLIFHTIHASILCRELYAQLNLG